MYVVLKKFEVNFLCQMAVAHWVKFGFGKPFKSIPTLIQVFDEIQKHADELRRVLLKFKIVA